jgi:hypothetical protein
MSSSKSVHKLENEGTQSFTMKLMQGPKGLTIRSLFHSKRVIVTFHEQSVKIGFGSSAILTLLYTEIVSWSVYRKDGNGDVHFMYQLTGAERPKKLVFRTRCRDVLESFLWSIDSHIADLMVHKGMASSTNEALSMFERFTLDGELPSRRGNSSAA